MKKSLSIFMSLLFIFMFLITITKNMKSEVIDYYGIHAYTSIIPLPPPPPPNPEGY